MGKPEDRTQIVRTLIDIAMPREHSNQFQQRLQSGLRGCSLNSAATAAVLLGNGNETFTLRIRFSFPIAAAQ